MSSFECFVAGRYLRARRKEKVISVITVISVVGVAAGVMALIISLAVNNGFHNTLQRNLLAATAHVNILAKDPGAGHCRLARTDRGNFAKCRMWSPSRRCSTIRCWSPVRRAASCVTLKGIDTERELATSDTLRHLKSGSLAGLIDDDDGLPGLIVGVKAGAGYGAALNSVVTVISPQGTLTPFGPQPRSQRFRVAGIFETDFFDVDDNWAYASLGVDAEAAFSWAMW